MKTTRRKFLAGSATLASAMALNSFTPKAFAAENTETWDAEADVIVVGSGIAGCLAALAALEKNASVIMLEKMTVLGGNSATATSMGVPCSFIQKNQGIKDDPELLVKDMNQVSLGLNHIDLTKIVAYESAKSLDLAVKYGTPFGMQLEEKVFPSGGHSVPRSVRAKNGSLGANFVSPMHKAIEAQPKAQILTACKVDKLIQDSTGKVIGVEVKANYVFNIEVRSDDLENNSGTLVRIKANKGVVVASGGYARDVEFRTIEQPQLESFIRLSSNPGSTGGMLRAMMGIGARSCHLAIRRVAFPLSLMDFQWSCLIDPSTGKRFVNEGTYRDGIGSAILNVLMNNGGRDALAIYSDSGLSHVGDYPARTDNYIKNGRMKKYNTIEEFAKDKDINPISLGETIANYDKMVEAGLDTEFGKPLEKLQDSRLGSGPYYVIDFHPGPGQCPGGIFINTKAEVINAETGKAIPHLYAAGEVTGGVHGGDQLGAASTTDCLAYGRIAGENAASQM